MTKRLRKWNPLLSAAWICAFAAFAALAARGGGRLSCWAAAAGLSLLFAAAVFWMSTSRAAVRNLYLALYLIVGVAYLCALPLFHVSDEQQHFLRSYQIASGRLLPEVDSGGDVGGYLPGNLIPERLEQAGEISWQDLRASLEETLKRDEPRFYSFPCSALYSPVSYLPQALGIRAAACLTDSPVVLAYAGRIGNLFIVLVLTYFALKWVPFGKKTMLLLLLAPIQMHKAASLSADALTLAAVVLLVSYTLYLQYGKSGTLGKRDVALLYPLVFLLSQCKIVYVPFCLLLFLIFKERFGSGRRYLLHVILIGLLTAAAAFGSLALSAGLLSSGFPDSGAQIQHMAQNPLAFADALRNTWAREGAQLLREMVGYRMGLGTVYNSRVLIGGYLALMVAAALFGRRETERVPGRRDAWIGAGLSLFVMLLICTALYVQWTAVAAPCIYGLQGRYFLPVLAVLLFALTQARLPDRWRRELPEGVVYPAALCVNLVAALHCFCYGLTVV